MSGADAPAPFRIQFDNARDPYTARNALGITGTGGSGGGAPTDAQYITAASNPTLTGEMVLTNTATVTWDFTTPGQAKANASGGGGGGGNVSNSGTPTVGQYGKWVTATTIQGVSPATVLSDIGAQPAGSYLTTAAADAAYQPLDGDLTAIAALAGTNTIYYRSAANTWSAVNVSTGLSFSGGNLTATGVASTPGGSTTQIQFNDSSAFGGDADLTWNKTTNVLTVLGQVSLPAGGNATSVLASGVVESGSGFRHTGVVASLAPGTAGSITLRPNGLGSATGQLVVASTGAVTVNGTIELGAATDTTLSRVSAGVVAIEGQNILTAATGQPLDADLTAIAALTGTNTIYYRSAANTWTAVTIGTGVTFSGGTLDAPTMTGDAGAGGTKGLVPAPATGDAVKYLRGDGTWQVGTTAATAGNRVLIQSQTVGAAVASVNFTTGINATYDQYEFVIFNLRPATTNTGLTMRISTDAGATYKAAAADYYYNHYYWDTAIIGNNAADTRIWLQNANASNAAGSVGQCYIRFAHPSSSTLWKIFESTSVYWNGGAGSSLYNVKAVGSYQTASTAIDAIRFLFNSGNIASGTFILYGIVK